VHVALRDALRWISAAYVSPVNDSNHLANIVGIADSLSAEYRTLFRDGRFRIGLAQKALNLYLKYLWCAGFAKQPPHCPVDAIILAAADIKDAKPWTKLDSIDEYARLIERLRSKTKGQPLAVWELERWSAQKSTRSSPQRIAIR